MTERLKLAVNVSVESATAIFGAGTKMNLTPTDKQLKAIIPGRSNTSVKVDDVFRILKPGSIEQKIGSTMRTLPILIIENTKGEQRPIYASGLMRQNPTVDNVHNTYPDSLKTFDRGILKDSEGQDFFAIAEKLIGNGTDFIKVTAVEPYSVEGFERDASGNEDTTKPFEYKYKAYALEFVDEATAKA